jgi:hypothetical protein
MAVNLQVQNGLGTTAQAVKDQAGHTSSLALSTDAVGIGTTVPAAKLHVNGSEEQVRVQGPATGNANVAYVSFADSAGTRIGYVGDGSTADQNVFLQSDLGDVVLATAGQRILTVAGSNGNVGIGTTTPFAKLVVDPQGGGGIVVGDPNTGSGGFTSLLLQISTASDGYGQIQAIRSSGSAWGDIALNQHGGNVGIGTTTPQERLHVEGNIQVSGDVILTGADCAEEFDTKDAQALELGTVMVIGDEDRLHQSEKPYDKRVAGVLSGAGDYRPGIILGKEQSQNNRLPLALSGKVFCKVDAQYSPIGVGDLLTTSRTLGHAMKVNDPLQAFGAVIGKALRPLAEGQGLIPILVALQ